MQFLDSKNKISPEKIKTIYGSNMQKNDYALHLAFA